MFDWFKNKDNSPGNVVPFPESKAVPPMPEVKPPKEEPATVFYRLGITNNNRVSFQMGYSEITMNALGVDNMIKLLEAHKSLLVEDEEEDNNEN